MQTLRTLTRTSLITAAFLLFSAGVSANCDFPESVEIPDGSTASEAELVAAQAAIKQYMASAEDYIACLDTEAEAIGPDITEDQVRIRDMRHDSAVDEMEKLAAEFNAQVRAFKRNNK